MTVFCKGTFDYSKSLLVGPRSAPSNGEALGLGSSGFLVVTPFHDQSSGDTILVHRGWVSRKDKALAYVDQVPKGQVVEFEGVVAPAETAGTFTPPRDPKTGQFFLLNPEEMGQVLELNNPQPLLIEQINGPGPLLCKSTDGMMTFKVHPATHLGYAATWYGLCGTSLYMIKRLFFK